METRRTNTNAIIGFGLSLGGYFVDMPLGTLIIIAGFIFSIIGLVQINERGEKGIAFAIMGLVLSLLVFFMIILAGLHPELLDYLFLGTIWEQRYSFMEIIVKQRKTVLIYKTQ